MNNQNLSQSTMFDLDSDDLHNSDLLCGDGIEIDNISNVTNDLDTALLNANLKHPTYLYNDNLQELRHSLESISRRLKLLNIVNVEVKN
ncbi:hypothetical protein GLP21_12035 [Photobacterium carnosum]|uniref:Uncharacterized protein n=1 Tax=Photobacterium carnosum TaxID=2023717 RepID=A0A2N4UVZ8_9GAMM|nr:MULTISPECIES: hypothetical protein [Photobacterium]MCD9475787.1 hypothetical protein [Photobacterium phosphoreum]MCD9485845.1 hypothetical protein [Photobacterium iliopiscarium]MCD9507648.1 hypothetical protein [Photobacterium phosphoreum]MCD9539522.1 hypothetical protein [Photobacterium carnosum]MCD9543200.1 hypothetical protein [Photobacterium carnosum]